MSKLFFDFLDLKRKEILFSIPKFYPQGILGGGTAISVQINHRRSFDFDLFTSKPITRTLLRKVNEFWKTYQIESLVDTADELSVLIDKKIKLSFIYFPFPPLYPLIESDLITLFDLKDLASNKAYVIGRRPVYRDCVDLFFILQKKFITLSRLIMERKLKSLSPNHGPERAPTCPPTSGWSLKTTAKPFAGKKILPQFGWIVSKSPTTVGSSENAESSFTRLQKRQ